MTTAPLISAIDLRDALARQPQDWVVCDCRFDLADTSAGQRAFEAGHLPGAVYLHLDHDLSGPRGPLSGRHPLPDRARLAERLAALGIGPGTRVAAYDAQGGMYAARLWWLLRWLGHEAVQVLDGGLSAWTAAGGSLGTAGPAAPGDAASHAAGGQARTGSSPVAQAWASAAPAMPTVDYSTLRAALGQALPLVVDARAPDRFRGENETLDPIGGHIPGAVNRFFRDNLAADGRFKPAAQLRQEWSALMAERTPAQLVQQCGSGVTACHNLLAMAVAGLGGASLYPGSWSEWCQQPDTVVATG